VTITTDRLGTRCLEPTRPRVKDSFAQKPRSFYAGGASALPAAHRRCRRRIGTHLIILVLTLG